MRLRKTFWLVAMSVALVVSGSIAYCVAGFYRGPTPEEFAVYAAFLVQLSADGIDHVALGDRSSKLVAPTGESWTPVELRPDPPEKAAPPAHFVEFCGSICAHNFMKQNLRSWQLKPSSEVRFPFPVMRHIRDRPKESGLPFHARVLIFCIGGRYSAIASIAVQAQRLGRMRSSAYRWATF
jgi:hypothetical protein